MRLRILLAGMIGLALSPAHAQVLGFDGDGFETCPHQVLSITSTSAWAGTFPGHFLRSSVCTASSCHRTAAAYSRFKLQ